MDGRMEWMDGLTMLFFSFPKGLLFFLPALSIIIRGEHRIREEGLLCSVQLSLVLLILEELFTLSCHHKQSEVDKRNFLWWSVGEQHAQLHLSLSIHVMSVYFTDWSLCLCWPNIITYNIHSFTYNLWLGLLFVPPPHLLLQQVSMATKQKTLLWFNLIFMSLFIASVGVVYYHLQGQAGGWSLFHLSLVSGLVHNHAGVCPTSVWGRFLFLASQKICSMIATEG